MRSWQKGSHLVGAQGDLAAAARAAAHAAVVAGVAHAVRELGLEADVAGGGQLHSGRSVHFVSGADSLFEYRYFVLFTPAIRKNSM